MSTLHTRKTGALNDLLFDEIREHPEAQEVKRIEHILDLLVEAQKSLAVMREVPEWGKKLKEPGTSKSAFVEMVRRERERHYEAEKTYHMALESLSDAMSRYRFRFRIDGDIDGFKGDLDLDLVEGKVEWEQMAAFILLEMLRHPNELARIRRCKNCRQWFRAVVAHGQFCERKCERSFNSQSPEFKEKRRVYMRERYRPEQKKRDQDALARAKKRRG